MHMRILQGFWEGGTGEVEGKQVECRSMHGGSGPNGGADANAHACGPDRRSFGTSSSTIVGARF